MVVWRCPVCRERLTSEIFDLQGVLECGACGAECLVRAALCEVCEEPGALRLRDSVHFGCRECGKTQTWYSLRVPA